MTCIILFMQLTFRFLILDCLYTFELQHYKIVAAIMNARRFTSAAVHKELSTLDTAKGSIPDNLHPFMLQIFS